MNLSSTDSRRTDAVADHHRYRILRAVALPALLCLLLCPTTADSEVIEWDLEDRVLLTRTSAALHRYYAVVRDDSATLRYLLSAPLPDRLRVRAQVTADDPVGRILMLRYGQLQLSTTTEIRIALGEELYETLLSSRDLGRAEVNRVSLGDRFGHHDWLGDHRITWSLFDRLDLRIAPRMNLFVGLGAPASGRDFWTDGTARIGAAHPLGEIALLLPFSGGSIGLGTWFPGRKLAPGIGGMMAIDGGRWRGRVRYTIPWEGTVEATRAIDDAYVPTLAAALTWEPSAVGLTAGELTLSGGVSYEEVTRIFDGGGRGLIRSGQYRRLAPILSATVRSPDETVRLEIGTYNLGLRALGTARLSSSLWLEVRMMHNDLFRDVDPFESPVVLFLTPRIKF